MGKTYSKAMIELVYEIRRRVPSELKPEIKFANPNLLNDLIFYYRGCSDAILKALIKELMVHGGEEWEIRLRAENVNTRNTHSVRVYRGSTSLEEIPDRKTKLEPPIEKSKKPKLIYRGQVVG